jgi:uncharacterized membrane protein
MTQKQALTPHLAAKHPRTPLAGPYGHPLHPLLVTIPIGAWSASLVFDLAAIFGSHPEAFTRGALWLIGIGVVGAILAAVLGLLDFSNLRRGTPAHRTGLIHLTINSVVLVLFIVGFLIRWGGDYGQVSVPGFIITIIALAMLGVSGWLGGRLAYHFGVRVADETVQAEGFRATG